MKKPLFILVTGLCLLMGACPQREAEGELDIDIGDYEYHLEAWNSQNMLGYKIDVSHRYPNMRQSAHNIIVKNGIPESNDCSRYWGVRMSTIPEFYSLIKDSQKSMKDEYDKGGNSSLSLKVSYNTEYHYPKNIISKRNGDTTGWTISLKPLEEGEIDIDIGDYENQLEAWNSQNMLDYQISMRRDWESHTSSSNSYFTSKIKNGIPDRDTQKSFFYMLKEATIPEIYSFIKKEEERIRNKYNGLNHPYLHVQYHPVYHYPMLISSGVDFFQCRLYDRLEIIIIPGKTE